MSKPDIIMLVLDTQRADRLGCYGNQKDLTPNIDRFASEGVLFEDGVSAAQWTIPSHASMFTGLYPTAHQLTQSNRQLAKDIPHLAEVLQAAGYETVGFCNNPLVGVLDNGLKRGFENFYNYAGSFPNRPELGRKRFFSRLRDRIDGFMRRHVALPVQNIFGRSSAAFSISLNPWLTPLWSRWFSFKGQNETAVKDVARFLQLRDIGTSKSEAEEKPLFLFLNLMETHLPFYPPQRCVEAVNPALAKDAAAQRTMREWNFEAYRWSRPLENGLSEHESTVLNSYYDAEVRYQDEFLQNLFDVIQERSKRENTLTIIVGDHGDGLGEHDFFGHAFVAYQELLHVPLILHWPKMLASQRVSGPVSTRRVFHTILKAAQLEAPDLLTATAAEIEGLSLVDVAQGRDVEQGIAFSEVYPPLNFVKAMEDRQPDLVTRFRCDKLRRAIVQDGTKLIQVDDQPDELFNFKEDQLEENSLLQEERALSQRLNQELNRMIGTLETQRENLLAGIPLELEQDPQLLQHLRGLGYIE